MQTCYILPIWEEAVAVGSVLVSVLFGMFTELILNAVGKWNRGEKWMGEPALQHHVT